jgi:D-alanine-D-alanine ligase
MMGKEVVILSGAISPEREVSLQSGRRVLRELSPLLPTRLIELGGNFLPEDGLDADRSVIFPLVHGDFGEDGQLQRLLERGNFSYVGSDVEAMELTINKARTKVRVARTDIPVLPHVLFSGGDGPTYDDLCGQLGTATLFLKPNAMGSSLHCQAIANREGWERAAAGRTGGEWLVEPRIRGMDLSVALLNGRALGTIAVERGDDLLSYEDKYIPGRVRHVSPAPLPDGVDRDVRAMAERAFAACGCRDWARIDFLWDGQGRPTFLEINAIPGFTDTSLYPDAAIGAGVGIGDLLRRIVSRALDLP